MVHTLLEWLAEAEQTLRFHGALPDDEDALRTLIDQHKVSPFQSVSQTKWGNGEGKEKKPVTVHSKGKKKLTVWYI